MRFKTRLKFPVKSLLALCLLAAAVWSTGSGQAQTQLCAATVIEFASVADGRAILTAKDDYVRTMSPFDRAARMKTDREVSTAEFLEHVSKNVLAWEEEERQKIVEACQSVRDQLEALSLPLPPKIVFIKTTGEEDAATPYTRANAIIFPAGKLGRTAEAIRRTVCHELFHVMSRANPGLREKLYESIGFLKCDEVVLPADLAARKVSNPDAPRNDHCIRVQVEGESIWVAPVLLSRSEKYLVQEGGAILDYVQLQFLQVRRAEGGGASPPTNEKWRTSPLALDEMSGFFEQVGRNTRYVIHPEEILADNFALLILQRDDLPSPEVIERLETLIKGKKWENPSP